MRTDHRQRAHNRTVNLSDIGRRVRARRAEMGWTQQKLATAAKVAIGTVQALENAPNLQDGGKAVRQTLPANLSAILRALDLPDELLYEPAPRTDADALELNAEDLEVARAYQRSSSDIRQRVLALVRHREITPPESPTEQIERIVSLLGKISDPGMLKAVETTILTFMEAMTRKSEDQK